LTPARKRPSPTATPATFEIAFGELQDVIRQLEAGPSGLDEVLALVERGAQLANHCDQLLSNAELNITRLTPEPASLLAEPLADT
jgi:exodeoxyribonuclease VII small subunit